MKNAFISLLLMTVFTLQANASDLEGFGVIREFSGTDTAAMFGLLAPAGMDIQITKVTGPSFLGRGRSGTLDPIAMAHLFVESSNPMSQQERDEIISKYNGAKVIYFQAYAGHLCSYDEIEHTIGMSGAINGSPFSATLEFIALPSSKGECSYHKFITSTQN